MKFSVLLPTRNRLDLLARAIETVRRQDYDNWEIIISDNYSEEDVAGYANSLNDERIKYFRTDRFVPVTDNWNNALQKSDGDYIIMLGDDDCLMSGYFSKLSGLIAQFDSPDFVYTSAFVYAYPGVLANNPKGFLKTYSKRRIFSSQKIPFFLDKFRAAKFVEASLNFRMAFDYNMQFSLVSRSLVREMKQYGQFYQSPYPDYYASNAIMLKAKRILVVPEPLVTIGISPKSFGYYYFNDAEGAGNEFLNNLPDKKVVDRVKTVILPGTVMNTSWLISMETLALNFGGELDIRVNYARYRLIQILAVYAGLIAGKSARRAYEQLRQEMSLTEWLRYGLGLDLLAIARLAPERFRALVARGLGAAARSHPRTPMPRVEGNFRTILDVFNQIDPVC